MWQKYHRKVFHWRLWCNCAQQVIADDKLQDRRSCALPASEVPPRLDMNQNPTIRVRRYFAVLTLILEPPGLSEVSHLLTGDGFEVFGARTPDEASRLLMERPQIGIVICDVTWQSTKGHEFYQNLQQKLGPDRALNVIFLAEAASINDVIAAMRVQAVDFLRKPATAKSLLDAARRADGILFRRSAERVMMRRATELLEATREVIEWLPSHSNPGPEDPAGAQAFEEEILTLSNETEDALALGRAKRELRRVTVTLKAQKIQRRMFGAQLVANPCWDMLLDLYEKTLLRRPVSVSSLGIASGVPTTTALRRMAKLQDMGYVRRQKDQADARRVFVELTESGVKKLAEYFESLD